MHPRSFPSYSAGFKDTVTVDFQRRTEYTCNLSFSKVKFAINRWVLRRAFVSNVTWIFFLKCYQWHPESIQAFRVLKVVQEVVGEGVGRFVGAFEGSVPEGFPEGSTEGKFDGSSEGREDVGEVVDGWEEGDVNEGEVEGSEVVGAEVGRVEKVSHARASVMSTFVKIEDWERICKSSAMNSGVFTREMISSAICKFGALQRTCTSVKPSCNCLTKLKIEHLWSTHKQ